MEAAKNAVNKVIGRGGQHDTTVNERVNSAVTEETVKPHRHEETTQAVDREVHQHHYHTTVQPLEHQETLPEKHTHQQVPVQEREFTHGDTDRVKSGVDAETAQFRDTQEVMPTTQTTSEAPVAAGEHVHHHVHETVQPVVHKETLQPEVVHTTIPVHETHHAQAEHHGLSTLPTKTLSEFEKLGGKVTGGSERHEEYEGHPRPYNPAMQSSRSDADVDPKSHDGLHDKHKTKPDLIDSTGSSRTPGGLTGTHGTTGSNVSGIGHGSTGTGLTSGGSESTGTALGGRTEGNVASRALDSATDHSSSGVGKTHSSSSVGHGAGTSDTSGNRSESIVHRDLEHNTPGSSSTGGTTTHQDRGNADTSSSNDAGNAGTSKHIGDVQSPRQGKDPNLVEEVTKTSSGGLRGEGADGSHSAVFGLTPDGHKYDDTAHGAGSLRPAHSKASSNTTAGDAGSRAPMGSGVAEQLRDPQIAEKGHGGPDMSTSGSAKPGAGFTGGSQGLGEIRPGEHGAESKFKDKMDPTTDADGDGQRGIGD